MTSQERQKRFEDIGGRLHDIRRELESLAPDVRFTVDQKAIRHILTALSWGIENCTVVGKHQIGEAMNDAMGMSCDGMVK